MAYEAVSLPLRHATMQFELGERETVGCGQRINPTLTGETSLLLPCNNGWMSELGKSGCKTDH